LPDSLGNSLDILGADVQSGIDAEVIPAVFKGGLTFPTRAIIRRTPGDRVVLTTSSASSPG
jgi:hypothetical protein